ncbi:hypothetical protein DY000_02028858 [Brassica cretica]|uniref:Uncharacterized protein n=1 Tax=Brassica cretica TaxID=69181 RepID=A0ABQ7DMN8_BRACR|nr:hypothetical protein DY000_02028858 [Brassica cretica]
MVSAQPWKKSSVEEKILLIASKSHHRAIRVKASSLVWVQGTVGSDVSFILGSFNGLCFWKSDPQ